MVVPSQVTNLAPLIPLGELLFTGSTRVKLYDNIFYVNSLCFLFTKSKDINFITIHHLKNRQNSRLLKILKHAISKYTTRGFTITDIFADNEFDHDDIHHLVLPANLQICAQIEHVPIIERSIHTVKEWSHTICQGLPYLHFPKLMTVLLLESIKAPPTFWCLCHGLHWHRQHHGSSCHTVHFPTGIQRLLWFLLHIPWHWQAPPLQQMDTACHHWRHYWGCTWPMPWQPSLSTWRTWFHPNWPIWSIRTHWQNPRQSWFNCRAIFSFL